jgi:hypothetical protein
MASYRIGDQTIDSNDTEALQAALASVYPIKNENEEMRPLCLCWRSDPEHKNHAGIPMYVSQIATGEYLIKRMPNSAAAHTGDCDSFELPPEMSGYGEVRGTAIQDGKNGETTLKLDFSLTEGGGRGATVSPSDADKSEVESEGKKLTLRSTLHYLWTEANLTTWAPGFEGKRPWRKIWKELHRAVLNKVAKGHALADILIVPEPFTVEAKDRIAGERIVKLSKIASGPTGRKRLMLLIGEYKRFEPSSLGQKLMIKHMPDFPFHVDEKLSDSFKKAFQKELLLLDNDEPNSHLMIIATFSFTEIGVAVVKKMGCMLVNENWLPYANGHEKRVLDKLKNRRFDINLCFNQKHDAVRPYIVLKDAHPKAHALYIIPDSTDEQYTTTRDEQAKRSPLLDWCWQPSIEPEMRALPISVLEEKRNRDRAAWQAARAATTSVIPM